MIMHKGRKTPLPAQLQEADPRRQWIYQNRNRLVQQALAGYQTGRRGALVVAPLQAGPNAGKIEALYLSDHAAHTSGRGWPDEYTAAMVRSYSPANELIIVMLHTNGSAKSYRIQFSESAPNLVSSA
jgi:hypothetical protein